MFAREKHKVTFLFSYFCMTKRRFRVAKPPLNGVAETEYTKSHLRGLSSLLKNTLRVHELVARAMRGECVRQMAKRK